MKKIITLAVGLLLCTLSFAQTDGISYQAVIIDPNVQELPGNNATGNILPNTRVSLQFTILNDTGGVDYQEIQNTTTDPFGMINVFIGSGPAQSGSFSEINWDGTPKDLKVDIDFNGGNAFQSLSEQKLTFVPFAFHRNIIATGDMTIEGNSEFNGSGIFNADVSVFGNTLLDQEVVINGTITVNADTQLNQGLTVEGETQLNNSLSVNNASPTQLSGTLNVLGETNLENTMQVNGEATFNNRLNVTQNNPTQLGGTLTVEGITTLNNDFIINGETFMNNGLTVTGNTVLNGELLVEEETTVQENLNVNGIANVALGLKVNNESASFLTGTLEVDGATQIKNTLQVTDETLIEGVTTITKSLDVGQELRVGGETNLNDTVTVLNGATTNLSGALNVQGTTNLESALNVNNMSVSNLSGELNVEGISNLNNDLNVTGISNLEDNFNVNNAAVSNLSGDLNVTGITTLNNDLNVNGISNFNDDVNINGELIIDDKIEATGLYISSDEGVEGDYVAVFENTNGSQDADGIAIILDTGTLSIDNHFVSFYGADDYLAGRIESYDLIGGDLWESFPIPDFNTLFNVFDFTQVLEWTPPSLSFTDGALPTAAFNPGTRPRLTEGDPGSVVDPDCEGSNSNELEFCVPGVFEYNFKFGNFPSLSFAPGEFPEPTFDIGTLNLNFDGFFNPSAGLQASNQIGEMVGWGMRNGYPGYIPTSHWQIVAAPLVLAAKQVARNQGIVYGSKGADYAEWLEKENPEENYMFGEVVGVKGGKISRNTQDADQVMTISYNPIVLGNMPEQGKEEHFEKVGFMGQVPALVAGGVEIGDFIVASGNNDGYAIAISPEDIKLENLKNIIGRAWSESDPSGLSMINVSVGLKTNEWIMIFQQQETKIQTLQEQLEDLQNLSEKVQQIEAKIQQLGIN